MHGSSAEPIHVDLWIAGLVVLCSLVLSAFFSGSETALTAASRARMHALETAGDTRAGTVTRLLNLRERFIGAMLLGNQLVNIGASAFTTSVLVAVAGDRGVVYATIIMTVLVVVFAEVMPKMIAINFPDRSSLVLARPVAFFVAIFGPVLVAVEAFVRVFLRLFGVDISANSSIISAHEELRGQVDLLHKEGSVAKGDRDMLGGLLDLNDLAVTDVMVHRTKMRTIDRDLPPAEIVREVLSSPYTRMPLYRERPDNIVGILHAKDLLRALDAANGNASSLDVADIALPAWFVPDTTGLQDQLKAFLKRKTHFALVVDEYGEVQAS